MFKKQKKLNHSLNIIKSRIADLSSKTQNVINKLELYKVSKPIFLGNYGFTYIVCGTKKNSLKKETLLEQKNKIMQKHYLIFSERHLKRLYNEASIVNINKIRK